MASNQLMITDSVKVIEDRDIKQICMVGEGTFGRVYKAVWENKYVAVKYLKQEQNGFTIEVNQLARVKHPNIVSLYGLYTQNKHLCLVMEFAEAGSLYSLLHCHPQKKYTSGHAMSWAKQCAEGVAHLHAIQSRALIHRDLKTMNLLLFQGGTVLKICDFGTATELKTLMTMNIGTMAYMAPEVFKEAKYNEKCDVYSWGIILWEIFSRQIPFEGLNSFAIMYSVGEEKRPPLDKEYPKLIENLITSCWDQNAANRPTMSDVVKQMLELCKSFPGGDIPLVIEDTFVEEIDHREINKFSFLGKFGTVYRAVWKNQDVIVKYMEQKVDGLAITQVSHPNIVNLYGLCTQEPNVCLVMEFCEGFSLYDVCYNHLQIKYTVGHAMNWMKQLAEVREFLYSVIPRATIYKMSMGSNILVVNNGTVLKINDIFSYLRETDHDNSSDVHHWGLILSQLLDLIQDNWISLFHRFIATSRFKEPLRTLISNCCDSNPANRPTMLDIVKKMKDLCKSYPGGDIPIFIQTLSAKEIKLREIYRTSPEYNFYDATWRRQCIDYQCIKQEQNPYNIEFRQFSWNNVFHYTKLVPIIDRTNCNPEIFEEFIHFLNTDNCKITDDNGIELLKLAIKYKVVDLENKVLNSLSSMTWVLKLFEFCIMEKYQMARKYCDELIACNYDTFLMNPYFPCLHPDAVNAFLDFDCVTRGVKEVDVFNAITNWIHSYCASNRITLLESRKRFDGLVKKIRFSAMKTTDFERCLKMFEVQFNEDEVRNDIPRKHFKMPYVWRKLTTERMFRLVTEVRVLDDLILCGLRIGITNRPSQFINNCYIIISEVCEITKKYKKFLEKTYKTTLDKCIITLGDSLRLKPGFLYCIKSIYFIEETEVFCRKPGFSVTTNYSHLVCVDYLSENMLEMMFAPPTTVLLHTEK